MPGRCNGRAETGDEDMPDQTATTDLTDHELGRILRTGTVIGFPLVFIASTVMTLHVGLANAITIAVLPTLFSGSFVGGLILLLRALRSAERDAMMTLRPIEQLPEELAGDPPLPVTALGAHHLDPVVSDAESCGPVVV